MYEVKYTVTTIKANNKQHIYQRVTHNFEKDLQIKRTI